MKEKLTKFLLWLYWRYFSIIVMLIEFLLHYLFIVISLFIIYNKNNNYYCGVILHN